MESVGIGTFGTQHGCQLGRFFSLGLVWLAYRKMYKVTAIFFAIVLVETLAEDMVLTFIVFMILEFLLYRAEALTTP